VRLFRTAIIVVILFCIPLATRPALAQDVKAGAIEINKVAVQRAALVRDPGTASTYVFSWSSKLLATANKDGLLQLWDLSSGQEVASAELVGHPRALALNQDGSLVAVSSGTNILVLRVKELITLKRLTKDSFLDVSTLKRGVIYHYAAPGAKFMLNGLAFNADSSWLLGNSWIPNSTRIWSLATPADFSTVSDTSGPAPMPELYSSSDLLLLPYSFVVRPGGIRGISLSLSKDTLKHEVQTLRLKGGQVTLETGTHALTYTKHG
jgi:WD40 repeat protein